MTSSTDPARAERVPDFFIVGHPKSGTTALYQMLRAHPQIFMPSVKEPRFLAHDLRAFAPSTPNQPDTLADYLALFAPAGAEQLVGEASSSYLRSREAASAIAELSPGARIIAIFREPASFVRSQHLQLLQEHVETEPDLSGRSRARRCCATGSACCATRTASTTPSSCTATARCSEGSTCWR